MKVRSIHHQMVKCARLEEEALKKAGLQEKDTDRPQNLVYHDPDFQQMSAEELRRRYGK